MEVRSRRGVPIVSDFAGSRGTPIVIDLDTGIAYILGDGDVIQEVNATAWESLSNKVTVLSADSTDAEYPSAKAVYDELVLRELLENKVTSISNTSTDAEYPSALAVYTEVTSLDSRLDTAEGEIDSLQSGKEDVSNKVISLSEDSTDVQYPSAKVVYDRLVEKQDTLVSGLNIRTIDGNTLLGSTDLVISSGVSYPQILSAVSLRI